MRQQRKQWIWVLITSWVFLVGSTLCSFACEVSHMKNSQHLCCKDKSTSQKNTPSKQCCHEQQYVVDTSLSINTGIDKTFSVLYTLLSANFISGFFHIPERIKLEPQEIPKLHSKISLIISQKTILI